MAHAYDLLAIDPGNDAGWAVFDPEARLISCGLNDIPVRTFAKLAIECPQAYTSHTSYADHNDLITVAIQVGRYIERFSRLGARFERVTPAYWKGNTPKKIHNKRVLAALTEKDLMVYHAFTDRVLETKKHNVIDAIGIGLYAFRGVKV